MMANLTPIGGAAVWCNATCAPDDITSSNSTRAAAMALEGADNTTASSAASKLWLLRLLAAAAAMAGNLIIWLLSFVAQHSIEIWVQLLAGVVAYGVAQVSERVGGMHARLATLSPTGRLPAQTTGAGHPVTIGAMRRRRSRWPGR
jgi:hypothetical protein